MQYKIFINKSNYKFMKITSLVNKRYNCFAKYVYTWGKNSSSLGYPVATNNMVTNVPKKIEADFDSDVKKVVMGPYHSAILTEKGNLYTFGYDGYGCLGHNDGILEKNDPNLNKVNPRKVSFFENKGLKVVDVAIGERHT
jgi:alpha-tubulin suppressor-like RCC1 family protein